MSLRSSDVTITASVETLKQKSVDVSITNSNNNEDDSFNNDSLEENIVKTPEIKLHDGSADNTAFDHNYLHVTASPRSHVSTSQRSVTMSRKSLRELPLSPPSHNSPRVLAPVPEFAGYKVRTKEDL